MDTESLSRNARPETGEGSPGPQVHRDHIVQFYEREETLVETVAEFLAEGLRAGERGLVFATGEHREAFRFRLAALGVDVGAACRRGQLTLLDARAALDSFMAGAAPDAGLFHRHVGEPVARALDAGVGSRARAYGEMVDLLWRDGNAQAAIRVEELWNDLSFDDGLSLLCAYAMGNFYREDQANGFDAVCRQHGRVIPAETGTSPGEAKVRLEDERLLRQRADALEVEVEHRKALEQALREALADRRRAEDALRRDIAERARVEAELRQAKEEAERANRVKAEFLAVMSHELRTPLNAIIGYEQLLSGEIVQPSPAQQREYLTRIRASAAQLLHLIEDVLTVTRLEAGAIAYGEEPVRASAVVANIAPLVEPLVLEKRLLFETDIDPALVVRGDPERIEQILLNLLSNAVKFTESPGLVKVDAGVDPADPLFVSLRVTDTGVGIPKDKQELVFDRFVQLDCGLTRQTSGTGLGLAISRELARGMGGDLTLHSSPGRGTTFALRLRRAVI